MAVRRRPRTGRTSRGRRRRPLALGGGIATVAACLGVVVGTPEAPSPARALAASEPPPACATAVIEDWAEDGHVQGGHPLPCYRDALEALPEDVRAYSTAPEDIQRALLSALAPPGN